MKTVVITGSARGFGYAMIELFYKNNFNVVVTDINENELDKAVNKLAMIESGGEILSFNVDVTKSSDIDVVIQETVLEFGGIDIWINNAGVNQPNKPIWELDEEVINRLIDIDIKAVVNSTRLVINQMNKQGYGAIYNVEGHGSNDATITGLSIYGMSKRAVTYFTDALIHETKEKNINITIGKITPGIMITNFISTSLGDGKKIILDDKTKKIYNILGDYPETIAKFMVSKIIKNKKKYPKFVFLSNRRAAWRFMTSGFNKKNYFE
ncbi:MAG: SDR family oxidoreductase [Bacilli bacterium]|nr:SDR family oxidoreductase [Bacilli bacterium]